MSYIHMEKVTSSLWRISIFVNMETMREVMGWFRGKDVSLCQTVVEHGHPKTKVTPLDEADWS